MTYAPPSDSTDELPRFSAGLGGSAGLAGLRTATSAATGPATSTAIGAHASDGEGLHHADPHEAEDEGQDGLLPPSQGTQRGSGARGGRRGRGARKRRGGLLSGLLTVLGTLLVAAGIGIGAMWLFMPDQLEQGWAQGQAQVDEWDAELGIGEALGLRDAPIRVGDGAPAVPPDASSATGGVAPNGDRVPLVVLGETGPESIMDVCDGSFFGMADYQAERSLQPVYAAHNGCGGSAILGLGQGDWIIVFDEANVPRTYEVTEIRDVQRHTSTTADVTGMPGELLLQTCYWGTDLMKFVSLEVVVS